MLKIPTAAKKTMLNKKNGKDRSWIQRVARRANEFGRQVPENIQIEEEVYDDFVDTFMTVVLWILLIGVLLFISNLPISDFSLALFPLVIVGFLFAGTSYELISNW